MPGWTGGGANPDATPELEEAVTTDPQDTPATDAPEAPEADAATD